jgi:hypothetical protein
LLNAKEEIARHRMQIFGMDKQNYRVQVIPVEMEENWIEDENSAVMKMQVLRTFRYNTSNTDSSQSEVVSLRLERDEKGNFVVTDYRIDSKDLTFNDMDDDYWKAVAQGNGKEFLVNFVDEYKNFISNLSSVPMVDKSNLTPFPVLNQWQFSTKCAEVSSDNKYVITYCDEKISCSTGLLTIENKNNFDITVPLSNGKNAEIGLDIPQNTSVAFALGESKTEYTVGVHADVKEDTEINFVVYENTHN